MASAIWARPLADLGPVAEVPLGDAQGRGDCPLGEAELLADQLAGEHPMLAGAGGGQELGHIHRVLLRLGRVADRAAGEQPHRLAGQGGGVPLDQLPGRLQPVAGIHGTAQHHRVVAVDPIDLIGRDDRRVEAMLAQHLPDHLGDLTGGAVLGRRRHQHSGHALRSLG